MKRLVTLVGVLTAFMLAATPAQARFLSVVCQPNQDAQVDPIVSPGVKPSAHLHTFYGATGVTQFSTVGSLEAAATSCKHGAFAGARTMTAAEVAGSTAGIWEPTMYLNGHEVTGQYMADYWSTSGLPSKAVIHDYPEGLAVVAGDAHATSPPPKYVVYWNCGGDNTAKYPSLNVPRNDCPSGKSLQAHVTLPECWDGHGLTTADTTYGPVANPNFQQAPTFGPCPAAFPVQLPHVQMILHTGLTGNVSGLSFSSGSPATLHADYWQTWDQSVLHADENWLRTGVLP
jgi:hypothetical protein